MSSPKVHVSRNRGHVTKAQSIGRIKPRRTDRRTGPAAPTSASRQEARGPSDQPDPTQRMEGRRRRRDLPERTESCRARFHHALRVGKNSAHEEWHKRQGDVHRRLHSVLCAHEDTMLLIASRIVRRVGIAVPVIARARGLLAGGAVSVIVPMTITAVALDDCLFRAHHVPMPVVPTAPQQPVGDEGRRHQQFSQRLKHEKSTIDGGHHLAKGTHVTRRRQSGFRGHDPNRGTANCRGTSSRRLFRLYRQFRGSG